MVLVLLLASAGASAQGRIHVSADQPGLTLQRVSGTGTTVMGTPHGVVGVSFALFTPLCLAPCDEELPTGVYQFAISRGSGSPVGAGDAVEVRGDVFLDLHYEDREGIRIAGWITWIGGLLAGGATMVAGAVGASGGHHVDLAPIIVGAVVLGLGSIIGVPMAFLNDDAQLHQRGHHSTPDDVGGETRSHVEEAGPSAASSADVATVHGALVDCDGIAGATLHVAIGVHGDVLRVAVAGVAAEAAGCARAALDATTFAGSSSLRQIDVTIDAYGPRRDDHATLRDALASCGGLPPGGSVALTVGVDGAVTESHVDAVPAEATACVERAVATARFLPRSQAATLRVAVPPVSAAVPEVPGDVEAVVGALIESRRASLLACNGGAAVAIVADWTTSGAVTLHLPEARQGTPEDGCVRAAGRGASLDVPPDAAGSLLHALE